MATEIEWAVDPDHSEMMFKVKHLMIAHVKGAFKIFDAKIRTATKDFNTSEIALWIDASSITTGNQTRDEHLKSKDFLDVENYKQITFTSSTTGKSVSDDHELWGELTIRGVTRNVKLNVLYGGVLNDPWDKKKVGFAVKGVINRSDWGLTWNTFMDTGELMVGEQIEISCEIELMNVTSKSLIMELEVAPEEKTTF